LIKLKLEFHREKSLNDILGEIIPNSVEYDFTDVPTPGYSTITNIARLEFKVNEDKVYKHVEISINGKRFGF